MAVSESDLLLIRQIRTGDADAWRSLVQKYQGRLLAFISARIRDRATCEDLVQETFVGFMLSLPNYQDDQDLEAYLFTIASHKLIDQYRRMGRSRTEQISSGDSGNDAWNDMPDDLRQVSSLLHSQERREAEHEWLKRTLAEMIGEWMSKGDYQRVRCLELIFVKAWANKKVAQVLGMSEPAVAGLKFQALARLKTKATNRQGRWAPE
jgi:RNA polymerase sigma-70 factor (ECF subfamily)